VKKNIVHKNNLSKQELSDGEVLRSLKVRVKLMKQQKQTFHQMFGATRFVYNRAIDLIRSGEKPTFFNIKSKVFCKNENSKSKEHSWLFDHTVVPRGAKDMAIHELCSSIAATKESLKTKNRKIEFDMKC
jgi:hypothetical protein